MTPSADTSRPSRFPPSLYRISGAFFVPVLGFTLALERGLPVGLLAGLVCATLYLLNLRRPEVADRLSDRPAFDAGFVALLVFIRLADISALHLWQCIGGGLLVWAVLTPIIGVFRARRSARRGVA